MRTTQLLVAVAVMFALMLDARWERAAEALLGWIEERGL